MRGLPAYDGLAHPQIHPVQAVSIFGLGQIEKGLSLENEAAVEGTLGPENGGSDFIAQASQSSLYYIDKHAWPAVSGNIFQSWPLGGKQDGGGVQKRPISDNFHALTWQLHGELEINGRVEVGETDAFLHPLAVVFQDGQQIEPASMGEEQIGPGELHLAGRLAGIEAKSGDRPLQ